MGITALPSGFVASVASILFVAGAQNWAKGHIKYLQNLTLGNAAVFGRSMRSSELSDEAKKIAM